jgi:hypothetical protein
LVRNRRLRHMQFERRLLERARPRCCFKGPQCIERGYRANEEFPLMYFGATT